ncbi:MAG: stage III sporulation AC/AD family protein [Clostridia bacterium]|nr:stage III sporulation AC/AD family protein [Clostridia bacterium]MBR3680838.1 stage III sporulation AC/AD family protein [Clostridia bacterium]
MTLIKHAALGLLVCILSLLLREAGFRGARLVSLVGTVALMGLAVTGMDGILDALSFDGRLGAGSAELSGILKIVGAGIVFGIITDMARDMGELGVASAVSCVGRVEIFALCMPYVLRLLELAAEYFAV